jgi:Ca2+-binding RTX toxin-like protein
MRLRLGRFLQAGTAAVATACALAVPGSAGAVTLAPGDIVVALDASGSPGGVERIDPVTGVRTAIARGFPLVKTTDVAVERGGTLVVTDQGGSAGVLRVDPASGAVTPLSVGGLFSEPTALALEADGNIVAVDPTSHRVLRVDAETGAQTLITAGGLLHDPVGVAVEADGDLLVGDVNQDEPRSNEHDGRLVRVDPMTGEQTLVTEIDDFSPPCFFPAGSPPCNRGLGIPFGVAVESDGGILVTSANGSQFDGLYRVDPVTGAATTLYAGTCDSNLICDPVGVALESDGGILLSGTGPNLDGGAVARVDPDTGAATLIMHADRKDDFFAPRGLEVVPGNQAPVAAGDSGYSTNEDTPLTVGKPGVLGNDHDPDADALTAVPGTGPAHGMVDLRSDGSFTYRPAENYNGPDSFTYTANDGKADSNVATVSLTVNPIDDPAEVKVTAGGACASSDNGGTLSLILSDPDSSVDGVTLSATSTNATLVPVRNVSFSGTGPTRTITVNAVSGKTGTAGLTITASGGGAATVAVRAAGSGNQTLSGTGGADLMLGQQGNDALSGGGGPDLVCGGQGDDTLGGGDGADGLGGGQGNDRLTGGAGPDRFSGGAGTDTATDLSVVQGDTQDGTIP